MVDMKILDSNESPFLHVNENEIFIEINEKESGEKEFWINSHDGAEVWNIGDSCETLEEAIHWAKILRDQ